jgi:two-component system sensor histidine kinase YesM
MIESVKKEENLELSVMDNGVGMDKETLEQLNALLAGDSPGIKNEYDWQSIGLKNVHDRIRYLYGEEYGIRVTSNVGVGTIVTVILPYEMNVVLESNSTP